MSPNSPRMSVEAMVTLLKLLLFFFMYFIFASFNDKEKMSSLGLAVQMFVEEIGSIIDQEIRSHKHMGPFVSPLL